MLATYRYRLAANAVALLLACPATSALAAEPTAAQSAPALAALGQSLNEQGQYQQAADHLERALMLDPSRKDAQLSYAIALTGLGQLDSAQALLADLLADPGLPPAQRHLIQQQMAALQQLLQPPPQVGQWLPQLSLSAQAGYDSNLLGSPGLNSLALTLAGQTLVLPLDASYLAQGGGYLRTDAQLALQRQLANHSRWDLVGSLRHRSSAAAPAGATQLDLLAEHSSTAARGHYLSLSASHLRAELGIRYQTMGMAGGAAAQWPSPWPGATCQTRLGAQWQARRYPDTSLLSGNYLGLAAFVACEQQSGLHWLLALKLGEDVAQDPQRLGGNQASASAHLAVQQPLGQTQNLLLDLERSQQQDRQGYSSIIADGASRSIARWAARLEYNYQASPHIQWTLGAEWTDQHSNLPLFGMRNWGSYSAVRLHW